MKKKDDGFTLIEMMIVLLIISILLLVAIPNMVQNSNVAQSKGCEATVDLVQAQVGSYMVETGDYPSSLSVLVDNDYVDSVTCPDGSRLNLDDNGNVSANE
ncbi:prepilin-type N-terminal cleavage/methylation domain-containing protein [Salicibibacter cibi]|uniref:ComG operon protein 3 n=1 Tax=Salicibibacter cibi TaxID=2743001 RepID=A0A7T7CF38_9BACI|nr:competence type IV pilus major pilin ComGC [Salicibibacter cibi]QQK79742.1 prepilin-type N-terminal cleavage/methylation domain-containing protein [Salicibibacter cibi]